MDEGVAIGAAHEPYEVGRDVGDHFGCHGACFVRRQLAGAEQRREQCLPLHLTPAHAPVVDEASDDERDHDRQSAAGQHQ